MNMPFQALRTQMPSFSIRVYVYALSIQDWPMNSQKKEKNSQKLNWSMCNQVASFKDQKATRSRNIPNSLSIEELSFLKYRHNLLYCVSFHCTSQILSFFTLKIHGNLALGKAISTMCLIEFTHFVSPCHILVIITLFQIFSLLWYYCGSL